MTYEWTNIGTEILPVQHRAEFLAHLRGEYTAQPAPETIEWIEPNGKHPAIPGLAIKAVVTEFDIKPVVKITYGMTWTADQHTHKPGPGPDAGVYSIVGVQTRKQSIYFIDRGTIQTPVLIETLPTTTEES